MKFFDVQEEYKKNKDLRAEDIRALQEWAQKLPHMPQISEHRLILFLHRWHWSLELAKLAIEKFVTCRAAWADFFGGCNPLQPEIIQEMSQHLMAFLPTKASDGSKILYMKMLVPDSASLNPKAAIKLFDMVITLELMEKGTFDDMVVVCDTTKVEASHLAKTSVRDTKRYLLYMQDALPVRLTSMHWIVPTGIQELFIPLVKPFIKKGLSQSLHFHNSYEALFRYCPRELFPKEVGGEGPGLAQLHEAMQRSLIQSADLFGDEEKLVANEALRDRRHLCMDPDLELGIDGSFKRFYTE
ncbi:hypothetical protein PPYR_03163 [Photinus pyralis]|uniref:CRAL-TRIO domain-containing protein n=1 Tax=Photinus pyralis TaxID=7054 RepID=A0A5N4A204_PHOPY|nr:alpha-tocopherol transfer protein-like isoform X2 [Photinus pyralis]KAB0791363.1 hypothetical protein PPYR_03163 [Photinus pyralis]